MRDFGDSLVLLFIILLLYILVYFTVNWIMGNKLPFQMPQFGKEIFGGRLRRHAGGETEEFEIKNNVNNTTSDVKDISSDVNDTTIDEKQTPKNSPEKCSCVSQCNCGANLLLLHYKKIMQRNPDAKNKIIVQLHSTDWCKFCQKMKPIWEEATLRVTNDPNFADKFLFLEQNQDECNSPGIKTVPAIFKFVSDENSLKKYENVYNADNLYNWILSA